LRRGLLRLLTLQAGGERQHRESANPESHRVLLVPSDNRTCLV
jgi:hypothetical protein